MPRYKCNTILLHIKWFNDSTMVEVLIPFMVAININSLMKEFDQPTTPIIIIIIISVNLLLSSFLDNLISTIPLLSSSCSSIRHFCRTQFFNFQNSRVAPFNRLMTTCLELCQIDSSSSSSIRWQMTNFIWTFVILILLLLEQSSMTTTCLEHSL